MSRWLQRGRAGASSSAGNPPGRSCGRWAGVAAVFAIACTLVAPVGAQAPKTDTVTRTEAGYSQRAEVRQFIAELVASHGFAAEELQRLFAQARYQAGVVAAMNRPWAEPPKWHEYAPQFVNPDRVAHGVRYRIQHEASLARAEEEFGVPAEVIVAIIGVETAYGRNLGSHRAVDALATLAFDYPRRAAFFRKELEHFLVLCRERGIAPLGVRGSFAGALGVPQFMPGSYRLYAVDYDGDGRVDLWKSPADVIGSVANYLHRHDWQRGQPVMQPARIETASLGSVLRRLDGGVSERRPLSAWERDGVLAEAGPLPDEFGPSAVVMLEQAEGDSYWVAFNNFFVITRYNRSRLYASAVWELARSIRSEHDRRCRTPDGGGACQAR